MSYAVGTHGLGDQCAPSYQLASNQEQELGLMNSALLRGWAVVVTDYEGLGTPGDHTYPVARSEGHAMLDAVRAAQRLPEAGLSTSAPVGVWGYSQGGGATAFAGELQRTYARELRLKGVAAGGVPADLERVAQNVDGGPGAGLVLMAGVGLHAAYSDLPFDKVLNEAGRAAVQRAHQRRDRRRPAGGRVAGRSVRRLTPSQLLLIQRHMAARGSRQPPRAA